MKITVLGAGAWGTTLAIVLYYNGHEVILWDHDKKNADQMRKKKENKTYLPDIELPKDMIITHKLEETYLNRNMIVIAVPTQFIRSVISRIPSKNVQDTIFVSVSKGIEKGTLFTVSQIIRDVFPLLPQSNIGVLSGPSHAEEVSKRIPTTVVAASVDMATSYTIQSAFMTSYFRVYTSTDVIGVEMGAAYKNVIAIGAGIIDGVGYGDNTKAALITRGISEIAKLGLAMGAKPETFYGLSGIGDLFVTCMSRHSRNRYVGEKVGSGIPLVKVLAGMSAVAEGVETCKSASALAEKYGVETPITQEVYKILFEGKDPVKATNDLMTRDKRIES